jgi:CRISPR type III-A-associated protein Csm2
MGTCIKCGKPTQRDGHRYCEDCFREIRDQQKSQPTASHPSSRSGLPKDYTKHGYFDSQGVLRPEMVVEYAESVAKALGKAGMTSNQLRRFFNKARLVEQRLDSGASWDSQKSELLTLKPLAANIVGRASSRREREQMEVFRTFIEENVDWAVASEKSFRKGFLVHFQSVIAYFKYYNLK